ncbi:kassorin-M-like [Hyperolius riggenbachi]|uniref:kassorin-M-like n=1 Tax=Hyperolius riggenbachi TaxID=752182 RepID=UPI0035A37AC5
MVSTRPAVSNNDPRASADLPEPQISSMLTLRKSMLLLFFLGMVSCSLAEEKRDDNDDGEEGEDKKAEERASEEETKVEKRQFYFTVPNGR